MYYNYDDDKYVPNNSPTNDPDDSAPAENPEDSTPLEDTSIKNDSAETDAPAKDGSYRMRFSEPWREPMYKETETPVENSYSPNHYGPGNYSHPYYSSVPPISPQPKTKKDKKGQFSFGKAICLVLVCAIIAAAAGVGASYAVLKNGGTPKESTQVVLGSSAATDDNNIVTSETSTNGLSANAIYALACQQVVGISTEVTTTNVFGQESSSAVVGSGFIISEDGYILTNYHVVEYADTYDYALKVIMYDGTSYEATVVGHEADNEVAVIKIDAENLSPVTFGNSANMVVGDTIYTVGNPLGELDYTMTCGIVSALDRTVSIDQTTAINMFQIDAAVNAGNSGGPVYSAKGEVLGIVTAKYSSEGMENLGFAIPISDAVDIATQLIENGYVSGKAFLGINILDVSNVAAQYYNIPSGAYIYSVNPGSCAEAAGLKAGDVIVKVDDISITNREDLKLALKSYSAGSSATLTISRSGQSLTLPVTFDESTPDNSTSSKSAQQNMPSNSNNPPIN